MKLLITGSAGFIGSHAAKAAMARGWDVEECDRRSPFTSKNDNSICEDLRYLGSIHAHAVLHLAAFSSNAGFADHLTENYSNNVMGFWNMLRLCSLAGARLVYASSSAVYGNSFLDAPGDLNPYEVNSEYDDCAESHYGRSKLINEIMAASFPNTLGLRIFNAYGPGDELKGDRCSPMVHMQRAKAAGMPFVCYDDGTQSKDFIHVSDVVEIIMRLIESDATGIVNVGTGVATSFNDLAKLVGCEVTYAPVPDASSYQYFTRADTTRLLSIIGPYRFKTLEEGLNAR